MVAVPRLARGWDCAIPCGWYIGSPQQDHHHCLEEMETWCCRWKGQAKEGVHSIPSFSSLLTLTGGSKHLNCAGHVSVTSVPSRIKYAPPFACFKLVTCGTVCTQMGLLPFHPPIWRGSPNCVGVKNGGFGYVRVGSSSYGTGMCRC